MLVTLCAVFDATYVLKGDEVGRDSISVSDHVAVVSWLQTFSNGNERLRSVLDGQDGMHVS